MLSSIGVLIPAGSRTSDQVRVPHTLPTLDDPAHSVCSLPWQPFSWIRIGSPQLTKKSIESTVSPAQLNGTHRSPFSSKEARDRSIPGGQTNQWQEER